LCYKEYSFKFLAAAELPLPGTLHLTNCGISEAKLFNKAEEPYSELIERKTRFVNLTEWLRMTGIGIRPSANSDCNEYGATAGKITC